MNGIAHFGIDEHHFIQAATLTDRFVHDDAVIDDLLGQIHVAWQKERRYGQRNYSELGMQRYKRILGRAMHARKFERQKQELMIGCGV